MSKKLVHDYRFDASAGIIRILDIEQSQEELKVSEVLLITNVTTGDIIYLFNDPDKLGSVDSNIITLDYDTSGMSDDDDLQIYIDYGGGEALLVNSRSEEVGIYDNTLFTDSNNLGSLLSNILKELKMMNLHLSLVTDVNIKREEVD